MDNFCSNIQIYNFKNKLKREEIIEKIANFKNVEKGKINEYVDLIFDETSNFVTMYDKNFKFENSNLNKSYIRKLSKCLTLPVFLISLSKSNLVIEQYNFNKRIYDYIAISKDFDYLKKLGYVNENIFNEEKIWDNFVGKNDMSNLYDILNGANSYFYLDEIVEDIFKLYGMKVQNILYKIT